MGGFSEFTNAYLTNLLRVWIFNNLRNHVFHFRGRHSFGLSDESHTTLSHDTGTGSRITLTFLPRPAQTIMTHARTQRIISLADGSLRIRHYRQILVENGILWGSEPRNFGYDNGYSSFETSRQMISETAQYLRPDGRRWEIHISGVIISKRCPTWDLDTRGVPV